MNNTRLATRAVPVTRFGVGRGSLEDTKPFSIGLIDSLTAMGFVCFVEREIGQAVPAADVTLENFDGIARIAAFAHALTGEEKKG